MAICCLLVDHNSFLEGVREEGLESCLKTKLKGLWIYELSRREGPATRDLPHSVRLFLVLHSSFAFRIDPGIKHFRSAA